jgi:Fe-S-cluster containining protein
VIYTKFGEEQYHEAFEDLIHSRKTIALKRRADGACIFISETGCRIFPLRSFICRVFPFWYDQDIYKASGELKLFLEERECLLLSKMAECKTMEEACRYLGNTKEEIKDLFKQGFEQFELANRFDYLFDNLSIDDAFEEIEKRLMIQEPVIYQQPAGMVHLPQKTV